jgi:hypothetical protein
VVKHVLRDGDGNSKKKERDERGKRRLNGGEGSGTQEKRRRRCLVVSLRAHEAATVSGGVGCD